MALLDRPRARRKLDVVGAQHFQHFGAHQSHDERELKNGECEGRQNDVMPTFGREQARAPPTYFDHITAAKTGEPTQQHSKKQNKQNANQKCWQ
jgi:hypothetical protein